MARVAGAATAHAPMTNARDSNCFAGWIRNDCRAGLACRIARLYALHTQSTEKSDRTTLRLLTFLSALIREIRGQTLS